LTQFLANTMPTTKLKDSKKDDTNTDIGISQEKLAEDLAEKLKISTSAPSSSNPIPIPGKQESLSGLSSSSSSTPSKKLLKESYEDSGSSTQPDTQQAH